MKTRRLGNLQVPAIGYGAMVLSPGIYGDIDDTRAEAALKAALDGGATHVDTSDAYGVDGHNERLVGRAIKGRRDELVVATKFGLAIPEGEQSRSQPVGFAFGELRVNAEARLVRRYAERSLRNLDTDVIDLYYAHYPDPGVPIEDTVGAMADLVRDGLIKHVGLSNVTAAQLRAAHAVHPVTAVQNEWSMWRPIDPDVLSTARELGVGIVAWSPLGTGFLTGTVQSLGEGDFRHNAPASPRTTWRPTTTATPPSAAWPPSWASPRPSSPCPGSCIRTSTWPRSPAAAPRHTSRRTCPPPT